MELLVAGPGKVGTIEVIFRQRALQGRPVYLVTESAARSSCLLGYRERCKVVLFTTESAARSSCLLGYTFVHNDSITVLCIKLSPPMSSSL